MIVEGYEIEAYGPCYLSDLSRGSSTIGVDRMDVQITYIFKRRRL